MRMVTIVEANMLARNPVEPVPCACGDLAVAAEKWGDGPRVLFGSALLHSPEACAEWPGEEQETEAEIVASA